MCGRTSSVILLVCEAAFHLQLIQKMLSFENLKFKLQNTKYKKKYVTSHTCMGGLLTTGPWYTVYEEVFSVEWNIFKLNIMFTFEAHLTLYFVLWNLDFVLSRDNRFWIICILSELF